MAESYYATAHEMMVADFERFRRGRGFTPAQNLGWVMARLECNATTARAALRRLDPLVAYAGVTPINIAPSAPGFECGQCGHISSAATWDEVEALATHHYQTCTGKVMS